MANGQKQLQPLHRRRGQSGETKQTLATEVVDAIVDSGVSTVRTPKHVMNKILGLETSFRLASDWLANTNQGVGSERDLRAIILRRCPSSYELQPVMDDNPSTHPLLLNTQEGFTYSDRDSDSSSSEEVVESTRAGGSTDLCDSALISPRQQREQNLTSTMKNTSPAPAATTGIAQRMVHKRKGGALACIVNANTSSKNRRVFTADHSALVSLKEKQLSQQIIY